MTDFDDLVIGSGMGGLTVAALLAQSGRRVLVLEAHDVPGGYAHTFRMGEYRFCAQVHYVFSCGEGETIHRLLDALGLVEKVPFHRLDPEGFDHVVVAGDRYRIPNGLDKSRDRLIRRHPEAERPLRRYFEIVRILGDELGQLDRVPDKLDLRALTQVLRFRHVLRYLKWTLGDLYDHVGMPPRLRAVLAGQCGDYLLPPRDVSLLLHVALVTSYDRGAYYPEHHYFHFVESIANAITSRPGCAILYEHEVERIETQGDRVTSVVTKNGARFSAKRFVSNVDPRRTAELCGRPSLFGEGPLRYDYSSGTITLYLAVKGLDLREHGFGSHNVWHYPDEDIDRIYDDQSVRHDLRNPWLFLSTPTLHSAEPGLCPPGEQILEVATSCDWARFSRLRREDRREYNREKKRIRETILDVLESRYVPKLREHLTMRVTGTPSTNERFCFAPEGNAYGSALTPKNVGLGRRPRRTALENLWSVNATSGYPSVAGTIGAGMTHHRMLSS